MNEQQKVLSLNRGGVAERFAAPRTETSDTASLPETKNAHWVIETMKWSVSFPVMLATLLVGRTFYEARIFLADPDLWWHLRVGREVLQTHRWPTVDTYSFTAAGTPWIAYEWLGEVILASVAKAGGVFALCALRFTLAAIVLLVLYYYGTLRSGNCKAGFVPAMVLGSLVLLSFSLRPQMFGYLFLVVLLVILEWFRRGVVWPLWGLPLMFLAWVNIHGSFIVGIGVLVVYLLGGLRSFQLGGVEATAWTTKQRIQLESALLLSLAVLPFTPYGTQCAAYPFDMMFNQPLNVAWIMEWGSMPFDQAGGKVFLAVVALVVALQFVFRFTWRLEELILVFGGTIMACLHVRMVLIFVPFFVPVFATMMARWTPPYARAKDQYALNGVVMAAVIAAMVYYAPTRDSLRKDLDASFPIKAVAYMDSHQIPGPTLNNYGFGGYLADRGHRVFIDGRADLFERAGVLADYISVTQFRSGAFTVLDRYGIVSCLLTRDEPLAVVMETLPGWRRVYADRTAVLFVRTVIAGNAPGGNHKL